MYQKESVTTSAPPADKVDVRTLTTQTGVVKHLLEAAKLGYEIFWRAVRGKQEARSDPHDPRRDGISLRVLVEDTLRARWLPVARRRKRFKLDLPVLQGQAPPAVDIGNRDALYDLMERR